MLIADNAGHKVYCEYRKIHVGENNNYIRFYSVFDYSRDPEYKQTKLELFLTDAELETLKQTLAQ